MKRPTSRNTSPLPQFYEALHRAFGPQHWWPGKTREEIIIGAILAQNTAWTNVQRAIARMRDAGALDWRRLRALSPADIADLVRPAGTFNVKARRLKAFVAFLFDRYHGRLENMADVPTADLRRQLLAVHGIGPETADCILLYALDRPTFVVDAYTRRVLLRHGVIDARADYETIKSAFEAALPRDLKMFNEYHAMFVTLGKKHCRTRARCEGCPLERFPHESDAK